MALMTVTPGTRVLGGLSAPRTSAAEQFQAGLQANLNRQDTKQAMRAREQAMELAQSEEARQQATFAQQQEAYRRQQAAAAEARNREAQRRALMAQYRAPGVGEAPVIFQPQAAPVVTPAAAPVNTTGYPVGVPVTRTGATRGRYRPDEGAGGVDALGGGAGADTLQPAVPSTVPTAYGKVISLDEVIPSYRPVFEQGLAAGPDPVYTTSGGDGYFVYSDGRVFDVENALSGGDPFDIPAGIQNSLRARVGVTAAPAAPAAQPAGLTIPPYTRQPAGVTIPPYTLQPAGVTIPDGDGQFPLVPFTPSPILPLVTPRPSIPPELGLPPILPTLPDGSTDWDAFDRQLEAADWAALEQRLEAAGGATTPQPSLAAPAQPLYIEPYNPVPLGIDSDQITEVDPTASAAMQNLQALSRRADVYNAALRIGNSVLAPTGRLADYILRTPEEGAQRAELEAERQRVRDWYASDEAQAIFQENPDLLQDAARDPLDFYAQRTAATERVPIEDVSLSFGTGEGDEADEGPVLSFGGGLRTAESDSPIDFILGQPVGSGAVAPIPRELPRLNAAIQQGVTERQRLVDAYNAFYQAGFTDDANAYLTAIQNLDQTLIRLQGEQALNDLSIGFPERASMVLSYYLGANVTLAPRAEGVYDLQVNGQDVADPELRGMTPQDAADLVRRYYDSGYQESMQEIRNTYLTEKAKRQAEQDVKDEAARQELEGLGYEVVGKETIEGLGDGWRSRDPRTGKEYFAYVVAIGEDGIPQTRVIEVPTGARIGG